MFNASHLVFSLHRFNLACRNKRKESGEIVRKMRTIMNSVEFMLAKQRSDGQEIDLKSHIELAENPKLLHLGSRLGLRLIGNASGLLVIGK